MALAQLKYNPGVFGDEELIRSFVVRKSTFELILETLRENTGPSNQHVLIVGPRGSGKTTLVRRVAAEVRIDTVLTEAWYPLVFAEESYLVSSSGEFWLEALFHLADQTQDERWERTYRELQEERDEPRLRDRALAQMMDFADENGARLLLIVENLNMLLGEQMVTGADWELRHTLLNEPRVMLLGTATNRFNEIENIDRAWFELFAIHDLKSLRQEECHVLWESVTSSDLPVQKLRPIQILTGGNPRLVKILAEFAVQRSLRELMDHLVLLIDEHTEYFKSHLDGLAPMERKVFVALLDLWDPASAREVGQVARMNANRVSVHLNRLVQRGAVEVLKQSGRRKVYQVAERLYNIYYLMRRRGHPSSRVRAAVAFMIQFYETHDLVFATAQIAKEACQISPDQRQDHHWAYLEIISRATDLQFDIIKSTSKSFFLTPGLPAALQSVRWRRLAIDLLEDDDFDEATEAEIRELTGKNPRNAIEWFLLGVLYKKNGSNREAEDAYRQAIKIEPSSYLAWAKLGQLLCETASHEAASAKAVEKRLAEALEALLRAIFFGLRAHKFDVSGTINGLVNEVASGFFTAAFVTNIVITMAAAGRAEEVIQGLSASEGGAAFEPLLVGLQIFLGRSPRKAQEIVEVGEDVAKRIRERQAELSELAEDRRTGDASLNPRPESQGEPWPCSAALPVSARTAQARRQG